ncbi:GpE family phage tail protein [Bordetella genomosp. 9]
MDEAVADIAYVFHWPRADLYAMALHELYQWRERARVRHNPES